MFWSYRNSIEQIIRVDRQSSRASISGGSAATGHLSLQHLVPSLPHRGRIMHETHVRMVSAILLGCFYDLLKIFRNMRKARLATSCVALLGICSIESEAFGCPEQFDVIRGIPKHIVVEGDTLWGISAKYSGSGFNWGHLFKINIQVCNPDLIYPGNELRIPVEWNSSVAHDDKGARQEPQKPYSEEDRRIKGAVKNEPPNDDVPDIQVIEGHLVKKIQAIVAGSVDDAHDPTYELMILARTDGLSLIVEVLAKYLDTEEKVRAFMEYENARANKIYAISPMSANESGSSTVSDVDEWVGEKVIAVIFNNGIGNTRFDAQRSAFELQEAVKKYAGSSATDIRFGYVYNATHGLINDLIEVFFQLGAFDARDGWERLIIGASDKGASKAELSDRTIAFGGDKYIAHAENYREELSKLSCGVVIVAHSQGNLFANWVYDHLDPELEKPHVRVISVATPASRLAHPGSVHFTNGPSPGIQDIEGFVSGDNVIAALELISPRKSSGKPLARNVPHRFDRDDVLGHGFIEAYVGKNDPVRDPLLKRVLSDVEALRSAASGDCKVNSVRQILPPPNKPILTWGMATMIFLIMACLAFAAFSYMKLRAMVVTSVQKKSTD